MKGKWQKVGVIGVDAGLCWIGDPCYVVAKDSSQNFESWAKFCEQLLEKEKTQTHRGVAQWNYVLGHPGLGVSTSTGWGDGEYPVYVKYHLDSERVAEVKVVFI